VKDLLFCCRLTTSKQRHQEIGLIMSMVFFNRSIHKSSYTQHVLFP